MLVAQNYVKDNSNHVEEQREISMLRLKEAGDQTSIARFGIEVTESSVAFMRNKSKLVHDVVKLAKYWNQIMLFKKYVNGRSSIMELLATKAGLEEENDNPNADLWNAFKRFLIKVRKIDEEYVTFQDYYDKSEIPSDIICQRPLLMDPVNPYNNLLSGKCGYGYGKINSQSENMKEFIAFMKIAAKTSLDVMTRFRNPKLGCEIGIFQPQPFLNLLPKKDRWIIPRKHLGHRVAIYPNSHPDIQDPQNSIQSQSQLLDTMPSFIIWNKNKSNFKDDFDAILNAYAGCIYNSAHMMTMYDHNTDDEHSLLWSVKILVQSMNGMPTADAIGCNCFFGDKPIQQYDITMKVPIKNKHSVYISFDFDLPN